MVYQVIIGNDGRPMHVPGGAAGRAGRREDGRPAWGGGGGGRRDRKGGGGGGAGDYHGYARREPRWEYAHHRSAAINRLAEPKRDYSDARVEQRPAWSGRGGTTVVPRQRGSRAPQFGGYHAPEPEPRFRGSNRSSKLSKKFPPLQRVHGMSRLDALRQQQEVQQEQLRELREQQREQQRQLAMQQEAELEELHSMQSWQQELQEKLANLEEQTMVTAEAILEEIEDARADVRNVTMKSLRELTTKRRQELKQQQRQPSPGREHSVSPKRFSPVFTPDDDEQDRAPSPATARTRRAVRKVQPDGLRDGATLQERRKWVEEMESATLEASMDDLLEEVYTLRKDVDAGVRGKPSPQRQRTTRKQSSTERDSRRRSPDSQADSREELKSPPVALPSQKHAYKSPPRAKGSIIGELRRAGLSVGLPDQAKSAAKSRAYDIAPPALRPDEQAEPRGREDKKISNIEHRNAHSRSRSPHRRSDADEIMAAVEEEERLELEAAQQVASDKLYAEVHDTLAEPWVESGVTKKNDNKLRQHENRGRPDHEEETFHRPGGKSVVNKGRETRRKKPHGLVQPVSSRRERGEDSSRRSRRHLANQRDVEKVSKLPSLSSVTESMEENEGEDEDQAEELRIKRALAAGNADEVRAVLANSSGTGGGGLVLATAGGGSDKRQLQRQDSYGSNSGSDSASSPKQQSPADPEKMRQLQQEAITHKEYVEMSLRDTGWAKSEEEPSYMRPVEKKKKHKDTTYDVTHVQEVLSRSSKLRMLRDQKAAAKRNRRVEAQEAAEQAAVSYVRAATG